MAAPDVGLERRGLLTSIVVTAVLGAIGVAWGIATQSQMILLDGVYAVIGMAVSWMLLGAAQVAVRAPNSRYPFGRQSVTPLVIAVQGFVLLATLLYAAFEAVLTIRAGGSEVTAGWAILYGVITTVGSLATWWWLRQRAAQSDLLVAEATAWRIGALRGVGMVVGFSVLAVLTGSSWDEAAPYVDPAMVLVTCAAFVRAPLAMVRTTVVELLEGAPDPAVQARVRATVGDIGARFELTPPDVRMTKVGPKLYVEVVGVVEPTVTVTQQQQVYEELKVALDELPYDVWLNVELTPRGPSSGAA